MNTSKLLSPPTSAATPKTLRLRVDDRLVLGIHQLGFGLDAHVAAP